MSGDKEAIADNFKNFVTTLNSRKGDSTLDTANKVFVKSGYEIKPKFEEYAVQSFGSEVQALDFSQGVESAKTINQWVEAKTNNKITELIDPSSLTDDTRVVLVNAIYFKGHWKHQFNKNLTAKGPFWTSSDDSVEADFMQLKENFNYGSIVELDATALELKYANSDLSFLILLPNSRNGLPELEQKLSHFDLSKINEQLEELEVDVTIPKFKVEHKVELVDTLKEVCGQMSHAGAEECLFAFVLLSVGNNRCVQCKCRFKRDAFDVGGPVRL